MALQDKLKKVDELKRDLDRLNPLKPEDQQRLDKKFRLEWNYNSNHLEGNTLTYSDTELLLIFDRTTGDKTLREYEEMRSHDVAIKLVEDYAADSERNLNEQFIRELNQILLVRSFWKDAQTSDGQSTRRLITPGVYKQQPNHVLLQNGELFRFASPEETPSMMYELLQQYQNEIEKKETHPIILGADLHYRFVRIHPFDDGNGRVARLLLNYVLLKNGYLPAIIKSEDKSSYLTALNKADVGQLQAFYEYVADQLMWSYEIALKAAHGESVDEPGDVDKQIAMLGRLMNSPTQPIKRVKSDAIMDEMLNDLVLPLFSKIHAKAMKLAALFASIEFSCYANDWRTLREFDEIEGFFKTRWKASIDAAALNTKLFTLRKISGNSFDVNHQIAIHFDMHRFRIVIGAAKEAVEQLYDQTVSEREMDKIVDDYIGFIVKEIQNRIENDPISKLKS